MKKSSWIRRIAGIIALGAGLVLYKRKKDNEDNVEERLHFRRSEIIQQINVQLKDVDISSVLSKQQYMYQKSIPEIQENIKNGHISYTDLVVYYLYRIQTIDQNRNGCNAVSEINPFAIQQARYCDLHHSDQPLFGIPVLVKENINTKDMPTSAGIYALKDFIPDADAPIISQLKDSGAIILGKTNLSEMAYFMSSTAPCGYSAKNGQTHNPFNPLKLSALGSSTGSAVAMALDLSTVSIGTETSGSIVAPASVTSTVGYKPSHTYIDGDGILPISYRLDTPGPITKTVVDAIHTYNGCTPQKLTIPNQINFIKGKRLGVLRKHVYDNLFWESLKNTLQNLNVELIEIPYDDDELDIMYILQNDYAKDLKDYFTKNKTPISSLSELISYNQENPTQRIRYGQDILEDCAMIENPDEQKMLEIMQSAKQTYTSLQTKYQFDALIFEGYEGSSFSALLEGPEVCVPFGIYEDGPHGVTFASSAGTDQFILNIAYSFEQLTKKREIPTKK